MLILLRRDSIRVVIVKHLTTNSTYTTTLQLAQRVTEKDRGLKGEKSCRPKDS